MFALSEEEDEEDEDEEAAGLAAELPLVEESFDELKTCVC